MDVKDGRVVKGVKFKGLRAAGDPVEIAKRYNDDGADELIFLDIAASHEDRNILLHVVEKTAGEIFMPLTVGGGVRVPEDIRDLLNAGADKVAINTAAVKNPEFVREASERFGAQCVVVAIDAKKVAGRWSLVASENKKQLATSNQRLATSDYKVYTHGGRTPTGLDALSWAQKMVEFGCGEILLTSMDRDGTRDGYDLELTRMVADSVPVPVIASGGVGTLEHLYEGFTLGHASAVLVASIFHYGEYTIREAKEFLRKKGVQIRGFL